MFRRISLCFFVFFFFLQILIELLCFFPRPVHVTMCLELRSTKLQRENTTQKYVYAICIFKKRGDFEDYRKRVFFLIYCFIYDGFRIFII